MCPDRGREAAATVMLASVGRSTTLPKKNQVGVDYLLVLVVVPITAIVPLQIVFFYVNSAMIISVYYSPTTTQRCCV